LFMGMCRIRVSLSSRSVVVTSSLICLVQNLSVMILLEGMVANISGVRTTMHLRDCIMRG